MCMYIYIYLHIQACSMGECFSRLGLSPRNALFRFTDGMLCVCTNLYLSVTRFVGTSPTVLWFVSGNRFLVLLFGFCEAHHALHSDTVRTRADDRCVRVVIVGVVFEGVGPTSVGWPVTEGQANKASCCSKVTKP